jgi:hypothetical protein
MYDRESSEPDFANEDTISRRAWIEMALASVRSMARRAEEAGAKSEKPKKPRLYVAKSNHSG